MVSAGGNGIFATPFDQQTILAQDVKELIAADAQMRKMVQELTAANTGHDLTQRFDLWQDRDDLTLLGHAASSILMHGLSADLEHTAGLT
jgi:hypothetical protein